MSLLVLITLLVGTQSFAGQAFRMCTNMDSSKENLTITDVKNLGTTADVTSFSLIGSLTAPGKNRDQAGNWLYSGVVSPRNNPQNKSFATLRLPATLQTFMTPTFDETVTTVLQGSGMRTYTCPKAK